MWARLIAVAAFVFIIYVVGCHGPAKSHDWYPYECCSNQDCFPLRDEEVNLTPGGYQITGHPHVIPYGSSIIKMTPAEGDGKYHLCTRDGERSGSTICLFTPNMGM